jgi:hypothetical protein
MVDAVLVVSGAEVLRESVRVVREEAERTDEHEEETRRSVSWAERNRDQAAGTSDYTLLRKRRERPPTAARCGCSLHAAAISGLSDPALLAARCLTAVVLA